MTIIKDYLSELDKFLQEFNKKNPELSKSQIHEEKLRERIASLRDKKDESSKTPA